MIIKLPNEGDSLTMKVAACEVVQGQYGEQVKFTGSTSDILFLPKDSADRQLQRIPLDYEECVGNTLTFSRDHNPKAGAKPFWGIALYQGASPAPTKRLTPEQAASAKPHAGPIMPFDADPDDPGPMDPWDDPKERHADAPKKAAPARTPLPSAPQSTIEADYIALFERVCEAQARIAAEHQIPMDGSSAQAMTFSIFNLTRNGR